MAPLPGGRRPGDLPRPPAEVRRLVPPEGQLKRDEETLAAALREVEEETGYEAAPGAPLTTSRYEANGRPKQVSYWAAEATVRRLRPERRGRPHPVAAPGAARDRLTQPRDKDLVDELLALRQGQGQAGGG